MFNQFFKYEDGFRDWRWDGMPGLNVESYKVKWMKRHGITILWIDGQKHQRRYIPDFLVEYVEGRKAILEVKDPIRIDSNDVQRKRKAADMWCRHHGMEYILATA
jgi:hypothetical protein